MTLIDPQNNLDKYIKEWQEANAQYKQDYAMLAQMIQQMLALAKKGGQGTEEAFQLAEMGVMPSTMTVQGDTMGQLAASLNLSSACEEFTTDSQNIANGSGEVTPEQGKAFAKYLKELYDDLQKEMNLPKNKQWIDSNTANNILEALDKISAQFGAKNPDELNGDKVTQLLNYWYTNPDKGQENIQNLQANFQSWNNSESAQSQSLTAQEQFASNTFNQYLNTCTDVFKSSQQQEQNFVQNQKSN